MIGTDSPVQYEPTETPGVRPTKPGGTTAVVDPPEAKESSGLMQTPAPCDYERATSVDGAIASLQRVGSGARIIAGGHSLIPMMKLRLATPEHLIDINDLENELSYIREDAAPGGYASQIRIGALTRHAELLDSELLAQKAPVFRDAEEVIADPIVRNRGTIGGSLCQADAAEDLSAVCVGSEGRGRDPRCRRRASARNGRLLHRPVHYRRRRCGDADRGPDPATRRCRQRS